MPPSTSQKCRHLLTYGNLHQLIQTRRASFQQVWSLHHKVCLRTCDLHCSRTRFHAGYWRLSNSRWRGRNSWHFLPNRDKGWPWGLRSQPRSRFWNSSSSETSRQGCGRDRRKEEKQTSLSALDASSATTIHSGRRRILVSCCVDLHLCQRTCDEHDDPEPK